MDDFSPDELTTIEQTTQEVGRSLFARLDHRRPGIWDRRWWDDRIMAWAMHDESVKVQMFRFIDVLPMLRHQRGGRRGTCTSTSTRCRQRLPVGRAAGPGRGHAATRLPAGRWPSPRAATPWRTPGGSSPAPTPSEVLAAAMRERRAAAGLHARHPGRSGDQRGRGRALLAGVPRPDRGHRARRSTPGPRCRRSTATSCGELPRVNVSVKLSALDSQFDPIDREGTIARVAARLRELLRVAREQRAFVHVDMESYRTKDLTLAIFQASADGRRVPREPATSASSFSAI